MTAPADSLRLVTPPSGSISIPEDRQIAGVLLAAGESTRFGNENKLLSELDGTAIVRHAVRPLLAIELSPVLVIVGHEAIRVREALEGVPCRIIDNPDFSTGQSTSVSAAVDALPPDIDAAIFSLGDMPAIRSATIRALAESYLADKGDALAAAFEGTRGNPVLFDATHFAALRDTTGDRGGRELLLEGDNSALVETGDPGVLADVDTPADLDLALELIKSAGQAE